MKTGQTEITRIHKTNFTELEKTQVIKKYLIGTLIMKTGEIILLQKTQLSSHKHL